MTPFLILAFCEKGIPELSLPIVLLMLSGMLAYHDAYQVLFGNAWVNGVESTLWTPFDMETDNLIKDLCEKEDEIKSNDFVKRIGRFVENIVDILKYPSLKQKMMLLYERILANTSIGTLLAFWLFRGEDWIVYFGTIMIYDFFINKVQDFAFDRIWKMFQKEVNFIVVDVQMIILMNGKKE
jgi:hypothetical protein